MDRDRFLSVARGETPADLLVSAGRVVARKGAPVGGWDPPVISGAAIRGTVRVDPDAVDLRVPAAGGTVRVIGAVAGSLLTEERPMELPVVDGFVQADPGRDVARLAVVERHAGSGRVGLGFVQGLGLGRAAVASTVAHDHHNLVVAGPDEESMGTALRAVVAAGGGLAVAHGGRVDAVLPLPLAGLMSDRSLEEVRADFDGLLEAVHALGGTGDPFMLLSFLGLEVIPSLKLTDLGLVDVDRFEIVDLFAPRPGS